MRPAVLALLLALAGLGGPASAEPYIAVQTGLKCVTCHVNPSGGGMRNAFANAWARNELTRRTVGPAAGDEAWTGELNRWLAVGGDLRGGLTAVDTPGEDERSSFGISRATLYGGIRAIPNLLTIYLDEQVAPGSAVAREAYALLTPAMGKYTIKAGKFFLPHGLRLQDDSAFIRQVPGINFDTPDHGVELGLELPNWSVQMALTNGSAGGQESDSTKQTSSTATYVRPRWRLGASYNFNNSSLGDREIAGLFVGIRTGPVAWLAEVDYITDETTAGDNELYASLIEGNWRFTRGHNLKITYEYFDPADDVKEDARERYSLVWEFGPMQMLQSRIGVRFYNGIPAVASTNRDELFAELHGYL